MPAHHGHEHRQREIRVVDRALLADGAKLRVRLTPLQQSLGDLLLVGNDYREHVGRHEGANEGADMDQRGAAGEHVGVEVSRQENPRERYDGEQGGPRADGRAAEAVISEPADREAPHRDADRVQGLEVQDRGIDHPRPGAQVELDDQKQEAGKPRQIRFPLEPNQVAGQLLRRNGELLDMVEAAAVHSATRCPARLPSSSPASSA